MPMLAMTSDSRKAELYSILPPSTQRIIIEHYFKVIAPEFSMIHPDHEQASLALENPLKWTTLNKDDPNAHVLILVFALATGSIARDLDRNMSNVSSRLRDEVQESLLSENQCHDLDAAKRSCTIMCALALYELILPTSGQIWELLGRASSSVQDLQEASRLVTGDYDDDLRRFERVFLKLERYVFNVTEVAD
jgi:hypothetical protein